MFGWNNRNNVKTSASSQRYWESPDYDLGNSKLYLTGRVLDGQKTVGCLFLLDNGAVKAFSLETTARYADAGRVIGCRVRSVGDKICLSGTGADLRKLETRQISSLGSAPDTNRIKDDIDVVGDLTIGFNLSGYDVYRNGDPCYINNTELLKILVTRQVKGLKVLNDAFGTPRIVYFGCDKVLNHRRMRNPEVDRALRPIKGSIEKLVELCKKSCNSEDFEAKVIHGVNLILSSLYEVQAEQGPATYCIGRLILWNMISNPNGDHAAYWANLTLISAGASIEKTRSIALLAKQIENYNPREGLLEVGYRESLFTLALCDAAICDRLRTRSDVCILWR